MPVPRATDVVCDANVVLGWFHDEGDEQAAGARALLAAHREGLVVAQILDLTLYEVANALMLGGAGLSAGRTATVLETLPELCRVVKPSSAELRLATALAEQHGLTVYDAAYAAVAQERGAALATSDGDLLRAGLGEPPTALAARLGLAASH